MRTTAWGLFAFWLVLGSGAAMAQNPLITDQFTADPTARVFEGKVYVYPSHDVDCGTDWFCMKDYHVFSSANLVDWTDHGVIASQEDVPWVDPDGNAMWAPDAYEKDGTYYFYFPAVADSAAERRSRRIGVATAETPHGPFTPQPEPIEGVFGIDPNVFIDRDGQAYLYWAGGGLYGAKLDENMLELASEPTAIGGFPEGFKEGPFVFEREGIYYFTFPHVIENTEALVYATGEDPLGPFEYQGIIMDEHASGTWTNHHSIVQYEGQWYLFYHDNDLSPDFDKNRSIRADSLFFNEDGTIRKVEPTLRGVGVVPAGDEIQIDRYSTISGEGASVAFLDTSNTFLGWKTVLATEGDEITFDAVDFDEGGTMEAAIRGLSEEGGTIVLNIGSEGARSTYEIDVPPGEAWSTTTTTIQDVLPGVNDMAVRLSNGGSVEIDWIQFE